MYKDMNVKRIIKFFGQFFSFLDRYKVLGAIIVGVVILVYFNRNSVIEIIRLRNEIHILQEEKANLYKQIREDSVYLQRLHSNNEVFEKYLREKFFYHQPNEDVYIIREQ